jgi:alpha-L-arabinofuranosidase
LILNFGAGLDIISSGSFWSAAFSSCSRGDKLTLFCVNRHLQRDLRASIKLTGFEAGSAHGQQLTSTTLYSVNDEVRPDAVIPADFDLKVKGSAFEHVFPKTSVTVIELARR